MSDAKDRVVASIQRARADLEHALADLDHLPELVPGPVGFVAHALANYLTVAGGTTDLLAAALAGHPDPQIRVWLNGIGHATSLMTHLTTELMRHGSGSGPDPGPYRPQLVLEPVDIPILVARVCQFYRHRADAKRVRLTADLHADEPFAWVDRMAVAVIVDNLISNAIKYSFPGSEVHVFVSEEPECLVCGVRDEGPGLSDEDQARLFQRGVRLSSQPTADESSTGYGLAIAKELSEALGGTLWCEAKLGFGALFCFRVIKSRPQHP